MMMQGPLPLLRDLPPLCPVDRCMACGQLVLREDLCRTEPEAIDCIATQMILRDEAAQTEDWIPWPTKETRADRE